MSIRFPIRAELEEFCKASRAVLEQRDESSANYLEALSEVVRIETWLQSGQDEEEETLRLWMKELEELILSGEDKEN